ncbi:two-component system, OmpR family, phosphate regulon sensor histidine kinase PhoR [Caloramator fervidus]|uniref:Phosphate regulon sensor protein PhoR n=1 Tax=Caloramator fervidus TaxID=29344 RepID=A0A1H5U1I4_9CLOT|nr:phosphate regulon sensor histidine kinase PhoR [Caloramator fervidus]SEF68935.1 two-component system, OmpR family, phosphate regulon sensor histidine kinase PhoR [Caloramator fervidus]
MRKKLIFFTMAVLIMTVTIMGALVYYYVKNFLINVLKNEMDYQVNLAIEYLKTSDLKDFDLIAKNIKSAINKRVTIIKKDGTVLGESDANSKFLENHKDRKEFIEAINTGIGISFRRSFTLDKMMFYYAKKFLLNGDILIMRISMELDLVKIMQKKILHFLFITVFVSLFLSSGLLWLFLNKFIEPIKELIKIATIISMGEYDKRIKIKTNDEIGQLGHAFNIMAARLEETILDLEDKRNKLISILKSMDDGVIVFDNNQNIILINPAAKKMFDIKEDVTGKHLIEVVKNLDLEDLIKENIEEEVELKISFPEVKYFKIRTTKVYNNDKANEDLGTLMVIQDVTKMKMLENMRSDFVANVSHELKTPLTSIKGFAETLKDVEDDKLRRKFLDIINIEAERLTKLINDILTLSELENKDYAINFEKLNVIELIEEVIYIMNPLAKNKDIIIDFENNCNEIIIYGDRDKFKQMMINLIDNAIKYTNEGGKVLLKALKLDKQVEIYVIDNGIGIPKEHLPRLFERFYRVDKARSRSLGGTGLGLAIVKHIVNLMKGKIDVYSEVGEGTTFKITFPL